MGMATVTASPLIRLHRNDNILVARENLALGAQLPEFGLRLRAQVPAGHKIAARAIAESLWENINLKNLHMNIQPTRPRADLILKKGPDHLIEQVALRKL